MSDRSALSARVSIFDNDDGIGEPPNRNVGAPALSHSACLEAMPDLSDRPFARVIICNKKKTPSRRLTLPPHGAIMRQIIAAVVLAIFAVEAHAQQLTPADVDTAIKSGLAGKRLWSDCGATGPFLDFGDQSGGFSVIIEGPVGRIMRQAAEAKKKYQPFTAADVSDDTLAPTLFLVAVPNGPFFDSSGWHRTPAAEHVLLKRKGAKGDSPADVLQPTAHEFVPTSWTNAMGGKWDGQGITASFELDAFRAMPGDEIDIVIVTPVGERRCKIGKKDRAALK